MLGAILLAAGAVTLVVLLRPSPSAPGEVRVPPPPVAAPQPVVSRPASVPRSVPAEAERPSRFDNLPPFEHPKASHEPPPIPGTTEIKPVVAPEQRKLTDAEKRPQKERAIQLLGDQVTRLDQRIAVSDRTGDTDEARRLRIQRERVATSLAARKQELDAGARP